MVEVCQSTIIDAPIADVWRLLRDFNGHDQWHPAVASSQIENGESADSIGSVRSFRLSNGDHLREQLLALSDEQHTLRYCLIEAPLPLMGYVACITLKPVTDGNRTFWEWRSTFRPPAQRHDELVQLVRKDIYLAGFEAVRKRLAGGPARPSATSGARVVRVGAGPEPRSPVSLAVAAERTRAIVVEHHGGPDVMQLKEVDLPPPGRDEVRLRHAAIGVNFIDVYCRTGYFDLLRPPGTPGMEAAGIIEAVGADVGGFSVGDRVAYACPPVGAYAERRNMAADLLVGLSPDISDEIAAAALLKGVSASFLTHDVYPVKAGDIVLVHAAAGGIGQLLVQWARHLGATVIATASSDEKTAIATRRGAHHVINYTREDFAAEVMRITSGRGADVIYDAVGKDTFSRSLEALKVRGHLVSFGQASGPVGEWDIGRFSSKSITVSRPNYGHFTDTPEKLQLHVTRFFSALRQGAILIDPPKRYPLASAADAHRDLESRATSGALILVP